MAFGGNKKKRKSNDGTVDMSPANSSNDEETGEEEMRRVKYDEDHEDDDSRSAKSFRSSSTFQTHEDDSSSNGSGFLGAASSETQKIRKLKFIIVLVLFFAVGCAIAVYFYIQTQEQTNFETSFHDDAVKVFSSLSNTFDFTVGGINALAVSLVSYAKATNQTFPFVTIPDWTVRAGKFQSLSKAYVIGTYMYVTDETRAEWENYTATHGRGWVDQALDIQEANPRYKGPIIRDYPTWDVIHGNEAYLRGWLGNGTAGPGPYLPWWQSVPVIPYSTPYNWDAIAGYGSPDFYAIIETHKVFCGKPRMIDKNNTVDIADAAWVKDFIDPSEEVLEPVSDLNFPLVAESADSFSLWEDERLPKYDPTDYTFAGTITMSFYWRDMIRNILPQGSNGIQIVISNDCSSSFAYQINGPDAEYLGPGDPTDPKYNHLVLEASLQNLTEFVLRDSGYSGPPLNHEICEFHFKVSASQTMEDDYTTNNPIIFSVTAGLIFLVFAATFIVYDCWVERRNRLITERAERSGAIVSSMFPESITRRLMEAQRPTGEEGSTRSSGSSSFISAKGRVKSFLKDGSNAENGKMDKPIADLFIDTTVYFADIQGFTAWSSSRDPSQVFVLLETIFKEFDILAKRRRVFKVETVGDCYVAVTGLPEPQEKHALIMARFAWDSLNKFSILTRELETELGPDTADLALRCGLHSGPVTAGVLRGDRARFQLFGDTVNTAARMESTGASNKIQISNATANHLITAGKRHWLMRREDSVNAKGKGVVATYWLALQRGEQDEASIRSGTSYNYLDELPDELGDGGDGKRSRLVDWMVRLLLQHVHAIMVRQRALGSQRQDPANVTFSRNPGETCLDEVKDVIKLPKFNAQAAAGAEGDVLASQVEVPAVAVEQLENLVTVLASTYRENEFHNFEHACHVTMSVDKFLRRIVNPDMEVDEDAGVASALHDYTHGINSDPLTIMAIVFSALIHDSDHRGVSNMQLCKEDEQMANAYRSKSVAEQNSLDLSWTVLMDDDFKDLRACIFANEDDLLRFRQVVVNVVLATDIFDKELNDLRKARWNRAFDESAVPMLDQEYFVDTRATIVIEHIIQASDVSHTMQHWHIYRKWNERLFAEMTCAFRAGRMGKDPATFWYKGEIGFFDNYIIPLAKKLKECRVFGVSSDECLNYAEKNRAEWEQSGQEVVAELIEKYADYEFRDVREDAVASKIEIVDI